MKPCGKCGTEWASRWATAEEAFTVDRTRPDGLALICRHCNAVKCREWHRAHRERKRQYALAYKAAHGRGEPSGRRRERILDPAGMEPLDRLPASRVRIVAHRVSDDEWAWLESESAARNIALDELLRLCINQARAAIARTNEERT